MYLRKHVAIGISLIMAMASISGCGGAKGGNGAPQNKETQGKETQDKGAQDKGGQDKAAQGKDDQAGTSAAQAQSGESKVITVFHYMGQSVKQDSLVKLEEAYMEAHPEITFENVFYNQGTDYFPQLSTALASGEQPDIIMGNPAMYPDLIENGYAMDLSDNEVIRNMGLDQYDLNDVSADGKVYAVPIDFKTSGIFYNKKIFEEQGIEVPKTRTQFKEVIQKLHDAGIDPFIDVYGEGSTGDLETRSTIWPRAIAAGDLDIFDQWMSGKAGVADYPYVEEALSVWDDRMLYPRTDAMANNQGKALELFIAGEGAMIFTGNWNIGEIEARGKDQGFEFDFFVPPIDDTENSGKMGVLVDQCFMVNPNADALDESLGFLEYWVTDGALTWSEGTLMPLITGESSDKLLPVVQTIAEVKKSGNYVSQGAFTKPMNTEFTNAWRKALISYAESVVTGKPMTHEECIANIQSMFDDIIATN